MAVRLALVLAFGACATPPPRLAPSAPAARAFARVELQVSNLEVGPPDRLAIDFDGAMRLVRVAGVPPAGIGFFETRLRPDLVRGLARALRSFDELPDHRGRIRPDDRVRRARVVWMGAMAGEKVVGTSEPVDARLAAILDRLEELARRTAEHPRQTVGLSLDGVTLGPGRMLLARAVVSATGTAAVQAPGLGALLGTEGALGLRLEAAERSIEIPVVDVVGPDASLVRLEPGHGARFELLAVPPDGLPVERVSAVVRWDGGGTPIAGELSSAARSIAPPPDGALALAWPTRLCAGPGPSVSVESCGCEDRLWCEMRWDGPEPVLVTWEDRSGMTFCTACRLERGACSLERPLAPSGATIRINDSIPLTVETNDVGALPEGRCWDVPRPTGGRAELEAIANRLGGPRAR